MSRVSIIVAAYNAEQYISKTIESLLNQSFRDIQILCVDDCSTDSTLQILKGFADRDPRVEIYSMKVNSGQAKARNMALTKADGEYITMVDSDDWLSADAIESAVKIMESRAEVDSVLFSLYYYYNDESITIYPMRAKCNEWSGEEAFALSLDWSIHGLYICRADLYRLQPFDDSTLLYSDDNTTRIHYLHSRRVAICDGIYYYRQHPNEMTRQQSIRRIDLIEANYSMKQLLLRENIDNSYLAMFERVRWINFIGIYGFYLYHKREFSISERSDIKRRFSSIYNTIERRLLPYKLKLKFGYIPFIYYPLFRLEAVIYFTLRRVCGIKL